MQTTILLVLGAPSTLLRSSPDNTTRDPELLSRGSSLSPFDENSDVSSAILIGICEMFILGISPLEFHELSCTSTLSSRGTFISSVWCGAFVAATLPCDLFLAGRLKRYCSEASSTESASVWKSHGCSARKSASAPETVSFWVLNWCDGRFRWFRSCFDSWSLGLSPCGTFTALAGIRINRGSVGSLCFKGATALTLALGESPAGLLRKESSIFMFVDLSSPCLTMAVFERSGLLWVWVLKVMKNSTAEPEVNFLRSLVL